MGSELEKATLGLLESLNSRYVCMICQNSGGEGKHTNWCGFYNVLRAWRERVGKR